MTKQPLVSVLLPTFNRSDLLKRAIDSVLKQNYPSKELIIIDDCSTDQTSSTIDSINRPTTTSIKVFRNKVNLGLAKSRNIAISMADGKYIATLDDDDEWIDPNKLTEQVLILEKNRDISLVYTGILRVRASEHVEELYFSNDLAKQMLCYGNSHIYTSSVLLRRSDLLSAGCFNEQLPNGIDSHLYRTLLFKLNSNFFSIQKCMVKVQEYGSDRMTQANTSRKVLKKVNSQIITLSVFWPYFLLNYPGSIAFRLKLIVHQLLSIARYLVKANI